jgi:hypothetical protein
VELKIPRQIKTGATALQEAELKVKKNVCFIEHSNFKH